VLAACRSHVDVYMYVTVPSTPPKLSILHRHMITHLLATKLFCLISLNLW